MCGIVCVASASGRPPGDGTIERMMACIAHRGPDDLGQFLDGGVALGFRRLAIIDLTSGGHQPMATPSGRPDIHAKVNYSALTEYFTFQNIFTDVTMFDGIRLLPPGTTLTIETGKAPRQRQYWDYAFEPDPRLTRIEDCADEVYRLFEQAVR